MRNDLRITLGDGADTITVKGWYAYNQTINRIERIEFANGTVYDPAYVDSHLQLRGTENRDMLYGSGANEQIFGFGGNDSIDGGAGSHVIDGGAGDDSIQG